MAERFIQPSLSVSDPVEAPGLDFRAVIALAGALLSLALLVGVGVWSYQLIIRDVSGVPVVRAAEGPIRVQPETPGGQQAAHQGLSVNAVAAVGEASGPADRLILAPPPLNLTAEDVPVQTPSIARNDTSKAESAPAPARDLSPAAESDDAVAADTGQAQLAGLNGAPQPVDSTADKRLDQPSAGLARSIRPRLRPEDLARVEVSAVDRLDSLAPVDPLAVLPGTGMAQLGSFDNEAQARDAWITLSAQFAAYLDGKQQVIQKAENGGRQFYRLRALGFGDISDARRFCSALVAEGAECIPVISR